MRTTDHPITIRDYATVNGGGHAVIHLTGCRHIDGDSIRGLIRNTARREAIELRNTTGIGWDVEDYTYSTCISAVAEKRFRALWTVPVEITRCTCVQALDDEQAQLRTAAQIAMECDVRLDWVRGTVESLADDHGDDAVYTSYSIDGEWLLTSWAREQIERIVAFGSAVARARRTCAAPA